MGRLFLRGRTWWIAYSYRGQEHRESAKCPHRKDATALLKRRLGEIARGRLIGPIEEQITFEHLATGLLQDYRLKGRRSVAWAEDRVEHLRRFFGPDRAVDITTSRVRTFAQARREEGASAATVNRDLAALRRMFNLALQAGLLSTRPHIPRLEEATPRSDFFEAAEYRALLDHLPEPYRDMVEFAYHSGWRRGQITGLAWAEVDRAGGVIRLSPERSKNKQGRLLPLSPPLLAVIERRWQARVLGWPYVFHVDGRIVGDWRKTWARACVAAGLFRVINPGTEHERKVPLKIFHGLRRTAVRNLIRAGVPERVAMSLTGHKTRSVFDRYNITSEGDLRVAGTRLAEYLAAQQAKRPTDDNTPRFSDSSRTNKATGTHG